MPQWRNKPRMDKPNYQKRRSFAQGKAEIDAAHVATSRLYCDALRFWRRCTLRGCKRHRRCMGDAIHCLGAGHYLVPPSQRRRAQQEVIAGGPRRVAPATHVEFTVRRVSFFELMNWKIG
ncbi:MAG: hypothetical protein WA177_13315 [Xanthobacteraceae bacterium]